jgi:hypothetical protein
MPRNDPSFSSDDIVRIFRNNLTGNERIDVRKRICTEADSEALRQVSEIFKLLKFGGGAFKAIGLTGELLFLSGAKFLEAEKGLSRNTIGSGVFGFLVSALTGIEQRRLNPELRLQRIPLRGGE